MGEIIRKINLHSLDDAAQFESWLSEQAKKGLLFRRMKGLYIWFEQTEPYEMEYRIVHSKINLTDEQRSRYEQLGWKLIFNMQNVFILAALKEENPSEEYFGEQEEKDFPTVGKGTVLFWCAMEIMWIFIAIDSFVSFKGGNQFDWARYEFYSPVLFICLGFLEGIIPYCAQRNYIKRVKEMGRDAHHISWKGAVIRTSGVLAVMIVMFIGLLVGAGYDFLVR